MPTKQFKQFQVYFTNIGIPQISRDNFGNLKNKDRKKALIKYSMSSQSDLRGGQI